MGAAVWENLRREHDSLKTLIGIFATLNAILESEVKTNGEYLEPGLVKVLKDWAELADRMLNNRLEWKKGRFVDSLVKQYDDVADELEIFRVGKPTKKGIPLENGGNNDNFMGFRESLPKPPPKTRDKGNGRGTGRKG